MNVIFHVTTALGVAAVLTDTFNIKSVKESFIPASFAFISGVIIHGILDYLPHTYPLSAKVDTVLGLLIIVGVTFLSNRKYTLIVGLAFLGSIFPDLVDLLPSVADKYLGLDITNHTKVFPWHWKEYSGSIFNGNDRVSDINHILVLALTAIVCWFRRRDLKKILSK